MHCFGEQEETWCQSKALGAEEMNPVASTLKDMLKVCLLDCGGLCHKRSTVHVSVYFILIKNKSVSQTWNLML